MAPECEKLQQFFINHLNRLHCVKAHVAERLLEIAEDERFVQIKPMIEQTVTDTEHHISTINRIYSFMNSRYSFENCSGLVSFMEDAFSSFQTYINEPYLAYIHMISYLHHAECIERAAIEVLQQVSIRLKNQEVTEILTGLDGAALRSLTSELTRMYLNEK